MFDTLIINAQVYNGLPHPPQNTRVAIKGDQIAAIAPDLPEDQAKEVIDATGLLLTPGFIDPHASTGFGFFFPKAADHKIHQGVTTEIFGNCGTSTAPIGQYLMDTMKRLSNDIGFPFEWRSMQEYMDAVKDKLQFNIGTLVGHSTLRGGHLEEWKSLKPSELAAMKKALAQAMDEGALGLSTGLIYAPGSFAETDEIIELAKISRKKGGIYASHIRDERDKLEAAVDEALAIGRAAETDVLVSHLKAAEKANWGKIPKVLEKIENYNAKNGLTATIDVYPYTAVSTKIRAFIPKHLLQDGIEALPGKLKHQKVIDEIDAYVEQRGYDLSQMILISNEFEQYFGKSVQEVAQETGMSLGATMAEVLKASTESWIVYHCINEQDMDTAILWKNAMICTDSWSYPINAPKVIGHPHPRSYGAFTTFLERYVLQKGWLSFEEAIHKITHLPAEFFRLKRRGQIKEGYFADLVLLDPKKIKANATYLEPKRLSSGTRHVWINGQQVLKNGQITETENGQILTLHTS
jgi:N-acyl-D-amino-acid deacylase